jgi:hypothetical protein
MATLRRATAARLIASIATLAEPTRAQQSTFLAELAYDL